MQRSDPLNLSSRLLLRRLLPTAVLVPILVGTLRYAGERAGLYSTRVGVILFVAFTSLALGALVVAGAVVARRVEAHDSRLVERLGLFREFFASSIDMFCVASFDGYFTYLNPAFTSTLGHTQEELLAKPFMSFVHPDDREATRREAAALAEGTDQVAFENRYRCKDGSYKVIQWHSRPLASQGLIYAVGRDVTALRAAESELRESQRRESLGALAGGVAHDFNNLLVGILGNADLLSRELAGSQPGRLVEQIDVAGRRAAELAQQMLAYSGKGRFVVEPLSLSELVRGLVPLLESTASKKAKLVVTCPDGLPALQGDATQVRQVVLNLLTNASEALDGQDGTILVTVGDVEADAAYLAQFGSAADLPEGRYVFVDVSDTGHGMDAETKTRIFDPYFTTKFTGRGLGLAAVRGIVEGHGGGLRVHSEPGLGSAFKVLFPAVGEVSQAAGQPASTAPERLEVLLADDEDVVRTVARRMLEASGCIVTEAHDGSEAVRLFELDPERFDCVVLDLMMPHCNGDETFERMRRIRPDVPGVISSGYNAHEVTARSEAEPAVFLQKPYGRDELSSALAEAVGRAAYVKTISPPAASS